MQNNFNPKIIWEKWVDPFGEDIDEASWNNYGEDNNTDIFDQAELKDRLQKPIKVIASPMGIIPYNEYTASGKIFNFWVGHSNFNLSKDIIDKIEKIQGIEILDVFTRYRFRIAIGKSFIDNEVMNNINLMVSSIFNSPIYYDS